MKFEHPRRLALSEAVSRLSYFLQLLFFSRNGKDGDNSIRAKAIEPGPNLAWGSRFPIASQGEITVCLGKAQSGCCKYHHGKINNRWIPLHKVLTANASFD